MLADMLPSVINDSRQWFQFGRLPHYPIFSLLAVRFPRIDPIGPITQPLPPYLNTTPQTLYREHKDQNTENRDSDDQRCSARRSCVGRYNRITTASRTVYSRISGVSGRRRRCRQVGEERKAEADLIGNFLHRSRQKRGQVRHMSTYIDVYISGDIRTQHV